MKDLAKYLPFGLLSIALIALLGGLFGVQNPVIAEAADNSALYDAALKKGAPILVGYFTPT
jgi:hypothetical protein